MAETAVAPVDTGSARATNNAPIPNAFEPEPEVVDRDKAALEKAYDVSDPTDKPITPAKEADEQIEGEAKPAEKASEEIPADEQGEDVDPVLLERALALGFTEDEINDMGSNAKLQRYVDIATPKEVKTAVVKEAEKPKEIVPDFKLDLGDEKEFDPKLVKALHDLNGHYAKKLDEIKTSFDTRLQQGLAPVEEYKRQQLHLTVDSAFAQMVAADEVLKPLVGEGAFESLSATHQSTRMAITRQGEIIENGYIASGQKVPPIKTIVAQAAQIVLGSKLKTVATEQVRSAVASRKTQFLSRGTPSNLSTDKGKSPEDRARAKAKAFLKEKGEEAED